VAEFGLLRVHKNHVIPEDLTRTAASAQRRGVGPFMRITSTLRRWVGSEPLEAHGRDRNLHETEKNLREYDMRGQDDDRRINCDVLSYSRQSTRTKTRRGHGCCGDEWWRD
jgi:hypothetical protein